MHKAPVERQLPVRCIAVLERGIYLARTLHAVVRDVQRLTSLNLRRQLPKVR